MITNFPFQVTGVLCPRETEDQDLTDAVDNQISTGAFTHHQKSVIVDAKGCFMGIFFYVET